MRVILERLAVENVIASLEIKSVLTCIMKNDTTENIPKIKSVFVNR